MLNYAEVKAIAIGNPLLKERVKCANELSRYSTLQQKAVEMRALLETEMLKMPNKISHQKELIKKVKADRKFAESNSFLCPKAEKKNCVKSFINFL